MKEALITHPCNHILFLLITEQLKLTEYYPLRGIIE